MIWIDRIIGDIEERFHESIAAGKPLVIRDEKTLSGRVHVGALRGIVLHGAIAQALQEKGIASKFLFELNDFDPIDGLPPALEKTYAEHMGKPLLAAPSPEPGHENYPMVFGDELRGVVEKLGLPIEWYRLFPLYKAGKFNDLIRLALENAAAIRAIYLEVSGGKKPDNWLPLQVICEQCGKTGTTQVTGWDGELVTYACKENLVTWAKGCGYEGLLDPFDGRGKLPWKVEWAAKWNVVGVQIEGCGKDHSAAGGSRSIAARVSEEVFHYPNPFDIPYEWFNIGGKKMSTSKGRGATAKDMGALLPPVLLKLLMIRLIPNRPIDFDPDGTTIPSLFDEYDRLSDHYFRRHPEPDEDFARTFRMTQLDPAKPIPDLWQMRFTVLSFILQMPHLHLFTEAEKLKGSALTPEEGAALEERSLYVRKWLAEHAPEAYKFTILPEPPVDLLLDDAQKNALHILSQACADAALPWEGAAIHEKIHAVKEQTGIAPKTLFQPLYQIFLGRTSGPQVGWFLSTIARENVVASLRKAVGEA